MDLIRINELDNTNEFEDDELISDSHEIDIYDIYNCYHDFFRELKVEYYMTHVNKNPSYQEIMDIDEYVDDADVFMEFRDVGFSEDDMLY